MADAPRILPETLYTRRSLLFRAAGLAGIATGIRWIPSSHGASQSQSKSQSAKPPAWGFEQTTEALALKIGTRELFRYQLKRPASGGPSVESGGYISVLTTPSGTRVTDVGPADHPHHRGIFLGWVEMHGKKDADFWGWGEPAPIKNRKIVNKTLETRPPALGSSRFRAVNEWMADGTRMLTEDIRVSTGLTEGGTMMDVAVQLSPDAETKLARWAFGGFAMRTPKDGTVVPIGPEGPIRRAAPKHTDPTSNWPDAAWYGLHLKTPDGKEATVAVANRKTNPPTTWHVVSGIGLINPAITAPGPVTLVPGKPLVLRYRVLAFDGPPKLEVLNRLGSSWYNATL